MKPSSTLHPQIMKRNYVHLSDLHFGRHDSTVIEALHYFLDQEKSQINHVLITGDFTQRARSSQFKAAADFIKDLGLPVVAIPGNHDMPLYNLWKRWRDSYDKYDELLAPHVYENFEDEKTVILGLRTTNKWTVKEGRFRARDAENIISKFEIARDKVKILLCHHPLFDSTTEDGRNLDGDQLVLRDRILKSDPDLILSGHGHVSSVRLLDAKTTTGHPTVLISAGTTTSNRTRTEANAFNWVGFENGKGHVETILYNSERAKFERTQVFNFHI